MAIAGDLLTPFYPHESFVSGVVYGVTTYVLISHVYSSHSEKHINSATSANFLIENPAS